jgi:hypothetical protein
MEIKRVQIKGSDELDILSAIWILACNDENPIITYEGIKYRLGLPDGYDMKSLIQSRGEMFRRGVPSRHLERWKQEMRAGKHLPSWIRDIEDEQGRKSKVEALTSDDVFRSQFRSEADAPRSPIEIIKWGLEHVDRLRRAGIEAREEKAKRITGIWVPILSMFVALAAVISSAVLQSKSINTQVDLKKYETTLRPKQDSYTAFMKALAATFGSAVHKEKASMIANLDKIESAYFTVEPFLEAREREEIWDKYQEYSEFCFSILKRQADSDQEHDKDVNTFVEYRKYFKTELYKALFG